MVRSAQTGTPAFSIRRAGVGDAEMVASLGARLFTETYGPTHPEPELSRYLARTFSLALMQDALASPDVTIFVGEDAAGSPLGYSFLRTSPDPPAGVAGARVFEIVRFYVDADAQGRGLGAALMRASLADAQRRNADAVWLQVWKEAPWAVGFYQRMGFAVVGSAPFYFGDQIGDDYIMSIDPR